MNLKDQVIDDFKIKVNITETLPIKRESFEVRRETNAIDLRTDDLEETISFGIMWDWFFSFCDRRKNAWALEGRFGCKACILHYLYNLWEVHDWHGFKNYT